MGLAQPERSPFRTLSPALQHVGGTCLGHILVGASGFGVLACGPRLLGTSEYPLLAMFVTLRRPVTTS